MHGLDKLWLGGKWLVYSVCNIKGTAWRHAINFAYSHSWENMSNELINLDRHNYVHKSSYMIFIIFHSNAFLIVMKSKLRSRYKYDFFKSPRHVKYTSKTLPCIACESSSNNIIVHVKLATCIILASVCRLGL